MIGPAEIEEMLAEYAAAVESADPDALSKSPIWATAPDRANVCADASEVRPAWSRFGITSFSN